jgi:hypothetical protein
MHTFGEFEHSESAWQPRHVFVSASQIGFVACLQSALLAHSTH